MSAKLVYITAGSQEQAVAIGGLLIGGGLAACANVLGPTTSIYRWEGETKNESEFVLLVKTTEAHAAAVVARVAEVHAYDCPCAVIVDVSGGYTPFLDWIAAETGATS